MKKKLIAKKYQNGGKPFTLKHNLPFIENIDYSKDPIKITYQYDFNSPVGISVIDMRKK